MKRVIRDGLDTIVRHIASNDLDGVATSLWKHKTLKEKLLKNVYCDIDKESTSLCSDNNPSLLKRKTAKDLIQFSEQKCAQELKERAPVLYGCMMSSPAELQTQTDKQKR